MKLKVRKIEGLIENVLAILLILSCNSVFLHSMNTNFRIKELIVITSFILSVVISLGLKIDKKTFNKLIIFFSIYFIYFFIFLLVWRFYSARQKFVLNFIIFMPIMIYCFFCYNRRDNSYKLLYKISDIAFIINIISLVFWISASLLKIIKSTGKMTIFWGKERVISSYFNIYFETQTIDFLGFSGVRNTSIFCEGAMFSLILIVALTIEVFLKRKINIKRCVIFFIGIISTLSTTGIISALAIIVFRVLLFKNNSNISKILYKIIKILFIILVAIVVLYFGYNILVQKQSSTSYSIRLDDYIAGYKSWINSPIIGNGYGSIDSIRIYMSSWRSYNTGFSNGIMAVLAQSGISLAIVYIFPIFLCISQAIRSRNWNMTFVYIIILELFMTTFWQDTNMLLLFVSLGYSLIFIKNGRKRFII